MTSDQLSMARALLRLTIIELAARADVDKMTINRFEAGRRPHAATVEKLRGFFLDSGVIIIGAMEPYFSATVAMKFGMEAPSPAEDEGK
jgi:transcriptional regulator with XRE-family HTH domain